jgi:cobalt-zinc-cadmium efflux system outer membrane protein
MTRTRRAIPFCLAVAALAAQAPVATQAPIVQPQAIGFHAYLDEVLKSNLDAESQRYDITSAEAQVSINRLFPDPQLTAGIASKELYAPSKPESPTQSTVGLSWTLELGGKRSARIAVAKDSLHKAEADREALLSGLYTSSANAFVDALKARLVLDRKRQTFAGLQELVRLNELRYQAGDIGGLELAQSRVEASRFQGEVFSAEADVKSADAVLGQLLGHSPLLDKGPVAPQGELNLPPRTPSGEDILAKALAARPDVIAARRALDVAASQQRLAKANRWVDLGLSAGLTHTPPVYATGLDGSGALYPTPANMSNTVSFTVSVPIPISRHQDGELVQAGAALSQARLQVQSAELKARTDVTSALAQYDAAAKRVSAYNGGVLKDTDKALEGVQFSYKRGSSSLLELINAQRTTNDVYLDYFDALAAHAKALIALDQASGSRTVDF